MSVIDSIKDSIKNKSKEDKIKYLQNCIFMAEMADRMDFELVDAYKKLLTELETGD